MKINYKILVKIRMWINNLDSNESDIYQGVRFNREHYIKVLEAKKNRGISHQE